MRKSGAKRNFLSADLSRQSLSNVTRILLFKKHCLPSGDLEFAESVQKDNRLDTNPEPLLAIALLSPGGNHRLGKIKKCRNCG